MCVAPSLLEVHNDLYGQGQVVVSAPCIQVQDLVLVGHLVVPFQSDLSLWCKLDYGVRTTYRNAVVGEEGSLVTRQCSG